jgi:hypothetical protein
LVRYPAPNVTPYRHEEHHAADAPNDDVYINCRLAGYFVGDRHSLELLSEGYAWSVSEEPTGRPLEPNKPAAQPQPNARSERLFWLWTATPQGVLKAAVKGALRSVPGGTEVAYAVDGRHVTTFINQLNQVERTETLLSDPVMGDVRLTTRYSGYRSARKCQGLHGSHTHGQAATHC